MTNAIVRSVRAYVPAVQSFLREHSALLMTIALPIAAAYCGVLVDRVLVEPANAAFFGNACGFMVSQLQAGTSQPNVQQVTSLIFNVLRGLLLLYVAYSLIQVVKSARDGEDWQTTARTPLIVILSAAVGDLITTLIIPAGQAGQGC